MVLNLMFGNIGIKKVLVMNTLKEDLDKKYKILLDIKEETQNEINQLNHQLKKKYWMFNLVYDELTRTKKEIDELPSEPKRCFICNKTYPKRTDFHNDTNVCLECAYNGKR